MKRKGKPTKAQEAAAQATAEIEQAMDIALLLGHALVGQDVALGIKQDCYRRFRVQTGDPVAATKAATVATAGLGILEAARRLGEACPGARFDLVLIQLAADAFTAQGKDQEAATCRGMLAAFQAEAESKARLYQSGSILGPDGAPAVVEQEPAEPPLTIETIRAAAAEAAAERRAGEDRVMDKVGELAGYVAAFSGETIPGAFSAADPARAAAAERYLERSGYPPLPADKPREHVAADQAARQACKDNEPARREAITRQATELLQRSTPSPTSSACGTCMPTSDGPMRGP